MATNLLPQDFKDFLRLLNSNGVEYLLIGGYAVGYYGYSRATADIDVWVAIDPDNANKAVAAIREFGFGTPDLTPELLRQPEKVIRMGLPPFRIEVLTTISGVTFGECYAARETAVLDGVPVTIISREHLKANKKACGRLKDLADLEHLP